MELLVASCPPLPAPKPVIALEVHDIFTVEAALIQIGPHRTVQNIVGVYTPWFCCGDDPTNFYAPSCCGNSFEYEPGSFYVASSDGQGDTSTSILSASSSTSTSTSTFSASSSTSISLNTQTSSSIAAFTPTAPSGSLTHAPTPSSHSTFKNATTIELGVGIPLGLLLLLSLGFLLYRERQRRNIIENLKREHQTRLSTVWQQQPRGRYPLVSDPADIQELENTHPAAGELDSQLGPIYEVAARH
ncbi:hypothetical protein MMC22_005410 [Lobaria immixta]|nr:hypothetical protein [Lobaria immixta]